MQNDFINFMEDKMKEHAMSHNKNTKIRESVTRNRLSNAIITNNKTEMMSGISGRNSLCYLSRSLN